MNRIRSHIARHPRQSLVIGKTLLLIGSILVVGAVFARSGLLAVNEKRAQAHLPILHTLAEAYPQYPTWVVPEGPLGYTVAAVLVLAGTALTVLGEKALKGTRG